MQLPIDIDRDSALSLQDQVMARVRALILSGKLSPGFRITSTRELSCQLGVARNTIALAYDRLTAEGYLEVRGRKGVYVCSSIPEDTLKTTAERTPSSALSFEPDSGRVLPLRHRSAILYQRLRERVAADFRVGRPAASSFPQKVWTRMLVDRMVSSGRRMTEYNNPAGLEELRIAIASHLKHSRGIVSDPDQVIIVSGCQEGLNVVAKMLSPPGAAVYLENPCYKGARFVFESYGAKIRPVPVDREGLCVDLLGEEPGVVVVTPSHQFPMGMTMSVNRRLRLLEWAARTGSYVIEDDYDSDFRYDGSPLTALAGLDRSRSVIYVGTFSKSIGAGLRLGYLVVPEELIGPAREVKALLNHGNSWLEQAVLADFISSGGFEHHLRRIRTVYMRRRDALVAELRTHFDCTDVMGGEGGMHLTWLAPDWVTSVRALQNECLRQGVGIYTLDDGPAIDFDDAPLRHRAVFMGYACLSEPEIEAAVLKTLQAALQLRGAA